MAFDRAKDYLTARGLGGRVMEFDVSSATVELAAEAVGCAPEHIAKTLSFDLKGRTILIVTAGDRKIDNSKFKAQFGGKAVMLPFDQVEERTGHAVGGVCPFAVKEGAEVFLDLSLKRFDTVYPACGNASSAVRLTPDELEGALEGAVWIDVCKGNG